MNQKKYLVYLHSIGFSQRKLHYFFRTQENYQHVYESISQSYLEGYGFTQKQIDVIQKKLSQISQESIDIQLGKLGVQIITIHDQEYPKNLKQISNVPYVLYVQGKIPTIPAFAVIGSRAISTYGKRNISRIVSDISSGFTIVSGGAYGCDSEAHKACLEAGGITCAIIGTGIDIVYPQSNRKLYNDIVASGGAIISIFPLGEPGNGYNFPVRNEIISGMSIGILVVEAAEKSGTLITAKLALDQGRDVFAIPGEIDKKNSIGCNGLLKRGEAKMVTCSQDIREEYSFLRQETSTSTRESLTGIHKEIYAILATESHFGEIIAGKIQKPLIQILPHLSLLEMKGILRKDITGKYELC